MIDALGLTFCTFAIRQKIFETYKSQFPDDRKAQNLQNWAAFESENKSTFVEMYMMWLKK
jgi:hypothetical protein